MIQRGHFIVTLAKDIILKDETSPTSRGARRRTPGAGWTQMHEAESAPGLVLARSVSQS